MEEITVCTRGREEMSPITAEVREAIERKGWKTGAVLLFCPHTTAGLTVNEGADPDVARDMLACLRRLVPRAGDYRHGEGNSDAHVKTTLCGPSLMLIVENGSLRLGTWQQVYLAEFDGPRQRKVWLRWLPGE